MYKSVNTIKKELNLKIERLTGELDNLIIDTKASDFFESISKRDLLRCDIEIAKKKLLNVENHSPILGKFYGKTYPDKNN